MLSEASRSTRRLSEVARHVKIPSGIVSTDWPAVVARCESMGIMFDAWQDGLGKLMLARRESGVYAASVGGVVMSIPRQTGKTYTVGGMVFALCSLTAGTTVIWTAHRSRTADETFASMRAMAQKPKVRPLIANVRAANGQQEISFANGSRILFGAREQGFGRGFAEIDVLVLDEAQILTEDAMSDMVPATNAAPNGLVLMMGTPPRPRDPGGVFAARRADALAGDQDTLYVEFSADRGASLDDWAQLEKANPSFPHRTTKTAVLRMRKLLGSDDSFRREAFGIWDEMASTQSRIRRGEWACLLDPVVPDGRRVFGVKFSVDGAYVALAGAVRPDDGPVSVAGIRLASTGEGIRWLTEFLAEREDVTTQIVVDGKSGASALVDALEQVGVKARAKAKPAGRFIRMPSLADYIEAHVMFLNAVRQGDLAQTGSDTLAQQVAHATTRKIGNAGGWGWVGIGEADDVTLLDAATLAFWGAKTTIRKTRRGGGR